MTPAVASERSIFSKNHDYNSYIKSFTCRSEHVRTHISGSRCTRCQKTTNRHTHTRDSQSDDNNKHYSVFEALKLNRYNTTYTYVYKTTQHEAHALI